VRTGHLRDSAPVTADPETGRPPRPFDAEYAVYQHERLDDAYEPGGPKFLETAL